MSRREIFDSLGYDVLTATDAIAALEVLAREGSIDILFSDVIMPNGMNGVELSHKAREMRPGIKVLLASGYPMSTLPSEGFDKAFPSSASPIAGPSLPTSCACCARDKRLIVPCDDRDRQI